MIAPGVDYTVTELVNARSLIERNPEALRLTTLSEEDTPCGVQLFGNVIQEMAEAARIAEVHGASFIDINMGCPAPKIFKNGGGSALLAQSELALKLVEAVVNAVKIPVTVKMAWEWSLATLSPWLGKYVSRNLNSIYHNSRPVSFPRIFG